MSAQHGQLFVAANDGGDSSRKSSKNVFGGDASAQMPTIAQWKSDIMPKLIDKMIETNYKRFEAVLKCGGYHKLEAAIIVWPPPKVKSQQYNNSMNPEINIRFQFHRPTPANIRTFHVKSLAKLRFAVF